MKLDKVFLSFLLFIVCTYSYAYDWIELGQVGPGVTWLLAKDSIKTNYSSTSGLLRWKFLDGTTRDEIWSFKTSGCKEHQGKVKISSNENGTSYNDYDFTGGSNASGVVFEICKLAGRL